MNYWQINTTKGETKLVPPMFVEQIKREIRDTSTTHLTIYEPLRVASIESFKETDKPYIDKAHQLEAGELTEAQGAFGIVETEYGVKCIAVKKRIPGNRRTYYEKSGYTFLSDSDDGVTIGFWIPAHKMTNTLERCTKEEAMRIR